MVFPALPFPRFFRTIKKAARLALELKASPHTLSSDLPSRTAVEILTATPVPSFLRSEGYFLPMRSARRIAATISMAGAVLFSPGLAQVGGPPELPTVHPAPYRVEILAEGMEVPWGLVELPDGRILLTERAGHVRVFADGKLQPGRIDNFPPIFARNQGGLLDVELHPDFEKNGWIYFAYSADEGGRSHTRILRARLGEGKLEDIEVIYSPPDDQFTTAGHHFGCRLEFGPDGLLYFSIGDRGRMETAQDLSMAAGKIHRIRDDGSVPEDNPFVNTPGALPTIWAYGTRNAQGLRFHPRTGDLWSVEHGPRGGDELNVIEPGKNYGWPVITYGINYNGSIISELTEKEGMEQPVIQWTPSLGVCGLEIVSDRSIPGWEGNLLVTALAHQKLVRLVLDGRQVTGQEVLLEGSGRIRHVKEGRDGTIYVLLEKPGRLVALRPAAS
jgi:glucose/arabinose dehydrogenase